MAASASELPCACPYPAPHIGQAIPAICQVHSLPCASTSPHHIERPLTPTEEVFGALTTLDSSLHRFLSSSGPAYAAVGVLHRCRLGHILSHAALGLALRWALDSRLTLGRALDPRGRSRGSCGARSTRRPRRPRSTRRPLRSNGRAGSNRRSEHGLWGWWTGLLLEQREGSSDPHLGQELVEFRAHAGAP